MISPSPRFALLLALSTVPHPVNPSRAAPTQWVVLFRNVDFRVSLDTAHVDRRRDGTFGVHYETWHLHGEVDQGSDSIARKSRANCDACL